MATLPSGLPEHVADDEPLARFLTQSSHYSSVGVKASAFLPNPKDGETSVFRHGAGPAEGLWRLAESEVLGDRALHGVGIVQTSIVRMAGLEVASSEPPQLHAVIRGWEWSELDPVRARAQRKEKALKLASAAHLLLR